MIAAAPPPAIVEAWSRPAIDTGVVYLRVRNRSRAGGDLTAARSPVAAAVELHRSMENGDMSTMAPVARLHVAPNGTLTLAPGGAHIMLIHLKHDLRAGERFPLSLHFARAGWQTVRATVRPI